MGSFQDTFNRLKAQKQLQNEQNQETWNQYTTNPGAGMSIYGTDEQKANQMANLSQVGAQTGQNLFQTGAQNQDYLGTLQNRRAGGSAGAQHLMNQRNRSVANMNRQAAGRGLAGGVAGSAANSAQNEADSMVAKEAEGFQKSNEKEFFDYIKRQQKIEGGALATGADRGLAQQIDVSAGEGITVICTELHRQGLMDSETFKADHAFGLTMWATDPHTMVGYRLWAIPVVTLMQRSAPLTKFVAIFALPWAAHMAGKKNLLGNILMRVGVPLCRAVGKWHLRGKVFGRV